MPNLGNHIFAIVTIGATAIIVVSLVIAASRQRRRTEQLHILFGPEYNRALKLYGNQQRAEEALENRRQLLDDLEVHELSQEERDEFLHDWEVIQSAGPNDPFSTLIRADALLTAIMRAEGCPADDSEERKIDLALIHPAIAEEYRSGSDVLERQTLGFASREECRRAVLRYANIFDSILGQPDLSTRLKKAS